MTDIAIFAAGCFWGIEEKFLSTKGVEETEVGYIGGKTDNPTYNDVCVGDTYHAEAVRIHYNSDEITYDELLDIFFKIHDPTTLNSQGPDFGTQYRSEIFYLNDEQKNIAQKIINEENLRLSGKVVTKLSELKNYCTAEEYHQKYLEKR